MLNEMLSSGFKHKKKTNKS